MDPEIRWGGPSRRRFNFGRDVLAETRISEVSGGPTEVDIPLADHQGGHSRLKPPAIASAMDTAHPRRHGDRHGQAGRASA